MLSVLSTPVGSRQQLVSAFCYATTSVCILIFNKIVLSTYRFNYPVLMTLFHMLVCVFLLSAMRKGNLLSYAAFDWSLARRAVPLSLCFVANIVSGMVALRSTDIPMFATLRRLTVLFVIANEFLLLSKRPTLLIISAVLIMILGSLIGGWGDLHFDAAGYGAVVLNNGITALYLVWMKRTFNDTKLQHDQFGVMYYNSLLAVPPLVVIALLNGEAANVLHFPYLWHPGFQLAFAVSALMSFFMNYSIFWCTQVNSALTTSVTGQVKNVMSSFVSVFAFGVAATPALIVGLSVGLSGSFLYAFAMYSQEQRNRKDRAGKDKLSDGLPELARREDDNAVDGSLQGAAEAEADAMDSGELLSPTSQSALISVTGSAHSSPALHPAYNGGLHGLPHHLLLSQSVRQDETHQHQRAD